MIPTPAEIKVAYKNATDEQKEYIDSDELYNTFYALKTKYKLHVDVAGNLALLIDAVILELIALNDLPARLKEVLVGTSDADYQAILKSINDEIFTVFRTQVRERREAAAKKKAEEEAEDKAYEEELAQEETRARAELEAGTTPPVPTPAAPSVLTQRLVAPTSSATPATAVPPTQEKPAAPTRYHGTDPYREQAE